ncbi:Band 7/SPFH domain superfamily [Arabidopsis suecica]|uniref:Flotillin-like n=1 Tax=Arabidopsis suecica TaxID=45249 RepID=A0A8T2CQG2_ARASU|nr:Band 7/SPFH domain superfamily [Arabidopsis suecica]
MSSEKLPFVIPAVFTIGPRVDDPHALLLYAMLMSQHDKHSNHVNELVQGVIEGETRVLAASMTMEEVFKGTKEFKKEVFDKVQLELNQFGLVIYNANVKQLVDVPGHEYFSYLGQRTQMEAANQAKIDVAEAQMKGEIGAKERTGLTVQNAAKIDADSKIISTQRLGQGTMEEIKVKTEVKVFENEKEALVAEADAALAIQKAALSKNSLLAEVEAAKAVALREAELQTKVEKMNALTQTEKLKAEFLSKASVEYETKVQEANWELYNKQKQAEAVLYEKEKRAEAMKAAADAAFYSKQRDAEGLVSMANAQGTYLRTLLDAVDNDYTAMRDFLMINNGVYQDIAKTNAVAIRDLQPKISVWNHGGVDQGMSGGGNGNAMNDIAGLYKMLPPILDTVYDQTGMQPPAWIGTLGGAEPKQSLLAQQPRG